MSRIITVLAIVCLFSCKKNFETSFPSSINGEMQSSDATSFEIIRDQKAGVNGYYPTQSDTIYAAKTPGIAVLAYGNSLMSNWRYVSWDATWRGIPIINRGVGGKTHKETLPYIQSTVFDYQPKVIVMYGEENVFLRATDPNVALTEAIKFFDSTYNVIRRKLPEVRFIVHSMITCPKLYNKGYAPVIGTYNDYMKAKVLSDSGGNRINKWIDIRANISGDNINNFKPDSIHFANTTYATWTGRLKPMILDVLSLLPPKATADNGGDDVSVRISDTVTVGKSWNYNPTLWGTKSRTSGGWLTSFKWEYVSGPSQYKIATPMSSKTKIENFQIGTYVFKLTASDSRGYVSTPDSVTLVVKP